MRGSSYTQRMKAARERERERERACRHVVNERPAAAVPVVLAEAFLWCLWGEVNRQGSLTGERNVGRARQRERRDRLT
jgi:hypothetical protein